jgi:hypothetical protein
MGPILKERPNFLFLLAILLVYLLGTSAINSDGMASCFFSPESVIYDCPGNEKKMAYRLMATLHVLVVFFVMDLNV